MDGDDYIRKTSLSFCSSGKDLYVLGMQKQTGSEFKDVKFKHKTVQEDLIRYPVYMNSVCNKFFNKSIIEEHGIYFDEKQYATEDLLFLINYLIYANTIEYIEKPYYIYRMDINSATHKRFTKETAMNNVMSVKKIERILDDSANYKYFLRYLRVKTALPFISNEACLDPRLYRQCIKKGDVWIFDARIDKTILSILAVAKMDILIYGYAKLMNVVKRLCE